MYYSSLYTGTLPVTEILHAINLGLQYTQAHTALVQPHGLNAALTTVPNLTLYVKSLLAVTHTHTHAATQIKSEAARRRR